MTSVNEKETEEAKSFPDVIFSWQTSKRNTHFIRVWFKLILEDLPHRKYRENPQNCSTRILSSPSHMTRKWCFRSSWALLWQSKGLTEDTESRGEKNRWFSKKRKKKAFLFFVFLQLFRSYPCSHNFWKINMKCRHVPWMFEVSMCPYRQLSSWTWALTNYID